MKKKLYSKELLDGKIRYKVWNILLFINIFFNIILFLVIPIYLYGFDIVSSFLTLTNNLQKISLNISYYSGVILAIGFINGYFGNKLLINK